MEIDEETKEIPNVNDGNTDSKMVEIEQQYKEELRKFKKEMISMFDNFEPHIRNND